MKKELLVDALVIEVSILLWWTATVAEGYAMTALFLVVNQSAGYNI